MDFKAVSTSLILLQCFFAFCSAGILSNDDRLEAGECLQSSLHASFRGNLSLAGFLGAFCVDDVTKIESKINDYSKSNSRGEGINLANIIRQCLKGKSKLGLFDKYRNAGKELETADKENAGKLPEPPAESNDSSQLYSSNSASLAGSSSGKKSTFDQTQPLHINVDDSDDVSTDRQVVSEFSKFSKGLCNSITEFATFPQLQDEGEKSITLNCSVMCVYTLFKKIQDAFLKPWDILQRKLKVNAGRTFPDSFSIAMDIQDITNVATPWLREYDDIYRLMRKHKNSLLISNAQVDETLPYIYFDYESCIRWQCAMRGQENIPLSNLINGDMKENLENSIFTASGVRPELSFTQPGVHKVPRIQSQPSQ